MLFRSTNAPPPPLAVSVAAVVKEAEVALILPPLPDLPSPDTSVDDSSDLNIDNASVDIDSVVNEYISQTSAARASDTEADTSQPLTDFEVVDDVVAGGRTTPTNSSLNLSRDAVQYKAMKAGSNSLTPHQQSHYKTSSHASSSEGYSSMGSSPQSLSVLNALDDSKRATPSEVRKSMNSGLSSLQKSIGSKFQAIKQTMRKPDDDRRGLYMKCAVV